jgi:hypothetical protein
MTSNTAVYLTASNGDQIQQMFLLPETTGVAVLGRVVSPANPRRMWMMRTHENTPLWQFIVRWSQNLEKTDWVAPFRPQFVELSDQDIADLNEPRTPERLIRRTSKDGFLPEGDMPAIYPDAQSLHIFEPVVDNINEGARLITWLIENDLFEA